MKEGWAMLHAKEAAQGWVGGVEAFLRLAFMCLSVGIMSFQRSFTVHNAPTDNSKPANPARHPYLAGARRLLLPRLPPANIKEGEGEEEEDTVDVCLLYRPRDTVFGIWGARPDVRLFGLFGWGGACVHGVQPTCCV